MTGRRPRHHTADRRDVTQRGGASAWWHGRQIYGSANPGSQVTSATVRCQRAGARWQETVWPAGQQAPRSHITRPSQLAS
jgi:hypothetical protein